MHGIDIAWEHSSIGNTTFEQAAECSATDYLFVSFQACVFFINRQEGCDHWVIDRAIMWSMTVLRQANSFHAQFFQTSLDGFWVGIFWITEVEGNGVIR